ncbi:GntR family transcriptional regulator [Roseococcus sp. SDR]|uniref:GntR family transcriptional regulator n=1 Tax=Roseococcus sp. SDR TaxID=2835532 RepID=UPI001BCD4A7C|nr:GntR family transcriptional regulator [Roseococcus sp. SDR]MBS7791955.1 GntR family transcriptional regulator [Roseococcus sp. SDR]MBV1847269.1 GntR family transcriptional regulator [Roseococcus sp. SDR]
MAGHPTRIAHALRARIFAGEHPPGSRLAEIPLAEALGVSRTPIRLALAQLEAEGLVQASAGGGFLVRRFTLPEIEDAIAVRGQLEGMAARLVAEQGLSPATRQAMEASLAAGDAALEAPLLDAAALAAYGDMNSRLHAILLEAAGNDALSRALAAITALPFAAASALVPHEGSAAARHALLRHAHHQHHLLVEALVAGQGSRAEGLMREHAENARRNLRLILAAGEPGVSPLVTQA